METAEQIRPTDGVTTQQGLTARTFNSGFAKAHDTYNGISLASDGNIYYVLSSQEIDKGGQVFCYHTAEDRTEFLADLNDVCGEAGRRAIAQGKSHVPFFEMDGKLYFSTHVGFYELIDGMERMPVNPPDGYELYPGGHILSFDLVTRQFEDLALAPFGEGFVSMAMDTKRGHIFSISWPTGYFLHYNVATGELKNLGKISAEGEAGTPGDDFRTLCRSLFVDSRNGTCYFSTGEGKILSYHPEADEIVELKDINLKLDYFGVYDHTRPGSMGYNWRQIFWYEKENAAYGVHGNSGYLFRFSPDDRQVQIVERITSLPSKQSGMFDQFSYGYLGYQLGPDKETIYYLTGSPIYENGKRIKGVDAIAKGAAKGLENLHLVTYHIPSGTYKDHGPIFYANGDRPLYVNAIAVGDDGHVYTLARITKDGQTLTDLVKFPDPLAK